MAVRLVPKARLISACGLNGPRPRSIPRRADWQSAKQQTRLSALRRSRPRPNMVAQAAEPGVSQVANVANLRREDKSDSKIGAGRGLVPASCWLNCFLGDEPSPHRIAGG